MTRLKHIFNTFSLASTLAALLFSPTKINSHELKISEKENFKKNLVNVLLFSNWYDSNFDDSKYGAVEIIHHGAKTAANIYPQINSTDYMVCGMNYLSGCYPTSNVSLVSAVGNHSKRISYGNNRADYTFITGDIVPGLLVLKPDFSENKEVWPFIWRENKYVVKLTASDIFLGIAVNDLFKK